MKIDFEEHRLTIKDKNVWLTSIQNKLLKALYDNKGKVVMYKDIIKQVYDIESDDKLKALIVRHMTLLRKKVGQYIKIKTVREVGYIIEEDLK